MRSPARPYSAAAAAHGPHLHRTEFFITALVIINMLFLLADMIITEPDNCQMYGNATEMLASLPPELRRPAAVDVGRPP